MKIRYSGYDECYFWFAFSSTTCYYDKESKTYKSIGSENGTNEKRVAFFVEIFRRRIDIYTPMKWSKFWAKH